MKEFTYVIKDEIGIHARPAGLLVKEAAKSGCTVTLESKGKSVDARKLMAIMQMGVKKGDELKVTVEGDNEEEAAKALEKFLEENL